MSDKYPDNTEENFLPGQSRENSFAVPEGYFETLAERIIARIEIEEELQEFALLSEIRDKKLFDVPDDYFQSAENALETEYELAAFHELDKIKKPVLENLTEKDYFEALEKKMVGRLEASGELKEFELLNAIDKKNNFALAADYFETVADRVKERKYAEANQPSVFAKLISYIVKPKIAFAYSILFIIGGGFIWLHFQSGQKVLPGGDCHTLACLEKREVLNEHTVNDFSDEDLYEMVDADALDKKLSSDSTAVDSLKINSTDSINK